MAKYFRAADMLPPAAIEIVMKKLTDINPDWSGGLIYFPSTEPTTGYLSREERALKRAKAVVFTEDGYSSREVAAMLNVSSTTIKNWKARYGDNVREVLAEIRGEKSDG